MSSGDVLVGILGYSLLYLHSLVVGEAIIQHHMSGGNCQRESEVAHMTTFATWCVI